MAHSITKAEGGNMRSQHWCWCCGSRLKVIGKVMITNKLFTQQVACLNPTCGWTGVSATEYTRTISPPSPLYSDKLKEMPPQLDKEEIRRLACAEEAPPA